MLKDVVLEGLTNEELIRLAKNGDERAYEYFFEKNIRLSHYIAHKFSNIKHLSYEDKLQLCNIGLIKAYNTFDDSKGIMFSTYSIFLMQNEVKMELRKIKNYNKTISIDETIGYDKEGKELKLEDVLEAKQYGISPDDKIDLENVLNNLYKNITKKQKEIFISYYIEGLSQYEIGKKYNISQSYVSRIISSLNEKIKQLIEHGKILKYVSASDFRANKRARNINIGQLKYIINNYSNVLNIKDISNIIGIRESTVKKYKSEFNTGKHLNVKECQKIREKVEKYIVNNNK